MQLIPANESYFKDYEFTFFSDELKLWRTIFFSYSSETSSELQIAFSFTSNSCIFL